MASDAQYPSDLEKTSTRFILDGLRAATRTRPPEPTPAEPPAPRTAGETTPVAEAPQAQADVVPEGTPAAEPGPETPLATSEAQCGREADTETAPAAEPVAEPAPEAEAEPWSPPDLPAGKKYFRMGEISELLGVEPHVLRYWQGEFSTVRPVKSGGGHWVYSRRDVEALHLIKHLLYVEKFSVKGARKQLRLRKRKAEAAPVEMTPGPGPDTVALKKLLREIKDLIQLARTTPNF